jgi:hypothetical protein
MSNGKAQSSKENGKPKVEIVSSLGFMAKAKIF